VSLEAVRRGDWIVGGLSLLLVIALLFLPWFSFTVGIGAISATATSTATGAPDGWLGVLGALAALAVLADLVIDRFSPQTTLPQIGGSRAHTRLVLAGVAALSVALKFLFHIHFGLFGWGFYVSVILSVALVYFAAQTRDESAPRAVEPAPPTAGAESSPSPRR